VLATVAVATRGQDVTDVVRSATTQRYAVIRFNAIGRTAVCAAASVFRQQVFPLLEREVRSSRGGSAFVPGDTNVSARPLEISKTPLPVVLQLSTRIRRISASVSLSSARAQLI
jgi:hypothetical protein